MTYEDYIQYETDVADDAYNDVEFICWKCLQREAIICQLCAACSESSSL